MKLLRKKLLSEADLTLARALEVARAMEVAERQAAQNGGATSISTMVRCGED